MSRYVAVRVIQGIITLIFASMIVFGLARLTGNPLDLMLPQNATEENRQRMTEYLGLDKPLVTQYWMFISNAAKGDFGNSYQFRRPVMGLIFERMPATIQLAVAGIFISLLVALPMGVLAALKRQKWQDTIAKSIAIVGQSAPSFWLGIMLILVFGVKLGWLPAGGYGGIDTLILPAITLATFPMAGIMRLTRSSMLEVLETDYVRLAKIKGVRQSSVIWKHALRNALIPVVTFGGIIYTYMLTGSVVTETVFAWPGVGQLSYQAVTLRDFPLIQGLVIIFVCLFICVNLAIDVLYCYLDPRVRYVNE